MDSTTEKFACWAIVELMGRQKYAGHVVEQTIAGVAFLRLDVPDIPLLELPAFTKLFGSQSIYAITPVAEEIARHLAAKLGHTPVTVWDLPASMREKLQSPALQYQGDDDEFDSIED
jgi:hypothetical protein